MSPVTFRDAVRKDIHLLIVLAGGTGSGKTESAMRLATGLAGGEPFGVIDTENGRALHKADDYRFKHAALDEPFTPEAYAEAINAASDFPVIVLDSGSHEYEGIGGVLDIQAEEYERLGNRESARQASWIEPKRRHKRFVQQLLRVKPHVILCLRAEDKIEIVDDPERPGKKKVIEKRSLIGVNGWIPICEKRLPFEATISLLMLQSQPGVPVPIKLERRHAPLVPLDQQLTEEVGVALAAWAAGAGEAAPPVSPPEPDPGQVQYADTLDEKLVTILALKEIEAPEHLVANYRASHTLDEHIVWLETQLRRAQESAGEPAGDTATGTAEPEDSSPAADGSQAAGADTDSSQHGDAPEPGTPEYDFAARAAEAQARRRHVESGGQEVLL